jgi:hypothetical protein
VYFRQICNDVSGEDVAFVIRVDEFVVFQTIAVLRNKDVSESRQTGRSKFITSIEHSKTRDVAIFLSLPVERGVIVELCPVFFSWIPLGK